MPELTYAVHTATCTYLLDDEGVCRWVHAPSGVTPPGAERCMGAQFVASLDLRTEGGLVGELRVGAAALFVREEEGRFVLLRTLPIEHVQIRDEAQEAEPEPEPIDDPHSFAETPIFSREPFPHPFPSDPTLERPTPQPPLDPLTEPFPDALTVPRHDPVPRPFHVQAEQTAPLDPRWSMSSLSPSEAADLEELLSISVTEVTLSLPLYRPPQPARAARPLPPPQPPPVRVPPPFVGPGRRPR